jgi:hypothetical protein
LSEERMRSINHQARFWIDASPEAYTRV